MKTQTRDRCVWLAAAAALVVVAGCSAVGWTGGSGTRTVTRNEAVTEPVTVSGGGRTLTVRTQWGGCDEPPRLRLSESADRVVLSVRVTTRAGRNVVCPAVARIGPVRATLRTALGSRTVSDATTGRRLPVHR